MNERISDLKKGCELRNAVALQIAYARFLDRNEKHQPNRNMNRYIREFLGLEKFFDYVKTLPEKKILDIGAGTTQAISQISQNGIGRGLDFWATVLSNSSRDPKLNLPRIEEGLGLAKTRFTSVESLRGFEDEFIGGIISCYGLGYCVDPVLALGRIDNILISGGILKAVFANTDELKPYGNKDSREFEEACRLFGWDCHVFLGCRKAEILTAVKPNKDNRLEISARDIFEADFDSYKYLLLS